MTRRLVWITVLVVLLFPALLAVAQAPDAINAALQDLSNRVGRTVVFNDLDNWSYAQSNYPSAALGCPQGGQLYADVITPGIQFTLTYAGNIYDYRVSNDQRIVILCGTTPAPEQTPPCPPPGDTGYLPPRLAIGEQARVTAGGLPNLIRDIPGTSGQLLGQIPPGEAFTVIDGPRCSLSDKLVWWQVQYQGFTGWTVEGQGSEYWLEPLVLSPGDLAIPFAVPITLTNVTQLNQQASYPAGTLVAVSADGAYVAWTAAPPNWLNITSTRTSTLFATAAALPAPINITSLTFNPTGTLVAAGGADGFVRVYGVAASVLEPRFTLQAHAGAVGALAFSPDGGLLVSGGEEGAVNLFDANTGTVAMLLAGHTTPVTSLTFSDDGSLLVSTSEDGTTLLWSVAVPSAG